MMILYDIYLYIYMKRQENSVWSTNSGIVMIFANSSRIRIIHKQISVLGHSYLTKSFHKVEILPREFCPALATTGCVEVVYWYWHCHWLLPGAWGQSAAALTLAVRQGKDGRTAIVVYDRMQHFAVNDYQFICIFLYNFTKYNRRRRVPC